jgi:hypothetical protein
MSVFIVRKILLEMITSADSFVSWQHKFISYVIIFQIRYRQVTGENLVLRLKCRCLTVVLLTLTVSHITILASFDFLTSVKNIPNEILYSYLVSLMNLTGLYWYFTFTALSRSAAALEESLSKVRKHFLQEMGIEEQ